MKKLFLLIVLASCVSLMSDVSYAGYAEGNAFSSGNTNTTPALDAYGQVVRIVGGSRCKATAAPPSYSEGDEVPLSCELDGDLRTNATGGGGGGAATIADGADVALGALADAAATAGGEGSVSAKLRNATALIDTGNTTLSTLNAKLPSAGALADDTANPTTTGVAAYNMCFDGSTWDRCVKGTGGSGTVDSATARTTEATDSQLSAGVGAAGDAAVTAGSTGSITGKLRQISADIDAIKTAVQLIDDDQTGASIKHFVTAGSTEDETEVKGSAGRLISVQASNSAATVAYLRCANQVAASTTPGTTTVFWGMAVPGATTGAGVVANFGPMGIAFSTGLTCWVVGGKAETDVAEVGANDVQVNIQYK